MRLVSYNVLANAYVNPNYYQGCLPEALEPASRRRRLLERIRTLNADILCLQEAEPDLIKELGLPGRFFKKSGDRPDGCAILTHLPGNWDELHYSDGSGHGVLMLQLPNLMVATTHLKWDPPQARPGLGLKQISEALERLRPPALICGDFNCERSDPIVLKCLESGLTDAFEQVGPNHSFIKDGQPRRIDFVLYSRELQVKALPMPTPSAFLPNHQEPSDHLPLVVELGNEPKA
ncbi:endonuclease/exonuclease/phosphatase family protein [bacterium]|nr:endonuclease/exonuclease/phosphatase family protein [bacterium]